MKIKEICERTGLTDRTVRYYIEEGLISPFYTENYLGRKSFDFSEQDLERLKSISTLRAFGFTVEEIKRLLSEEGASQQIVDAVKKRTEESLDESQRRLGVLSALDGGEDADFSTLARKLSSSVDIVKNETSRRSVGKALLSFIRAWAVFLAVWLPPAVAVFIWIFRLSATDMPILRPIFLVCTALCFIPAVLTVFVFQRLKGSRKLLRGILTGFCALCLPAGIFLSWNSVTVCNHSYCEYRIISEATCSQSGETVMKCRECGRFETQITEMLPHAAIVVRGVEPTCRSSGLSEGSCCGSCGITLLHQEELAKKQHEFERQVVEQSCGVDGCVLYVCACGDSYKTDIVAKTNRHRFQDRNGVDYACLDCGLVVVSHGNVDGSMAGGNDKVKYYITGPACDLSIPRTLVIYGSGDMPNFREVGAPAWLCSYMLDVTTVIIESGITSISDLAFAEVYGDLRYYSGVRAFIIRSRSIEISAKPSGDDHRVSGIKCGITFDY